MLLYCDQDHQWYELIYAPFSHNDTCNSKHGFDSFSFCHIFSFMLVTFILKYILPDKYKYLAPIIAFTIGVLFEIWENAPHSVKKYRDVEIKSSSKSSYNGDSVINVFGDLISNLIGIYLGYVLAPGPFFTVLLILFVAISQIIGLNVWTDALGFLSMFN